MIRHLRALALSLTVIVTGGSALANEPVSFKGKTVTMIIGFAGGGGTDIAGRLIAAHLGKYLPGQPNVIVQNMPGAEGMTAMNFFGNQAKPDGLTITMGSGRSPTRSTSASRRQNTTQANSFSSAALVAAEP